MDVPLAARADCNACCCCCRERPTDRREGQRRGGGANAKAFKAFGCGDERGGGGLLLRIPPSLCGVILACGVLHPLAASVLARSLALKGTRH